MSNSSKQLSSTQKMILSEMDIPLWEMRKEKGEQSAPQILHGEDRIHALQRCAQAVAACSACSLAKQGRTQTVFGAGNPNASLMLLGEAPGEQEDLQGLPFVGRSGQLLTNILKAVGLDRDLVYISNTVKCRPPSNRTPLPEEVATCAPFLNQQIDIIRPKLMVAIGLVAARALLQTDGNMSQLRGQLWQYAPLNIPLLVTYHPAYLLRSPREKRRAYDDWLAIQSFLESTK